jgi:hypothetical protein
MVCFSGKNRLNMRIISLTFTVLFFCSRLSYSQDTFVQFEDEGPDQIIRLSFIHFLDPLSPGPHVSYEHRLRYNTYLRYEVGVLFDYGNAQTSMADLHGFRIRTARRAYRWNGGQIKQRYYWEIATDYRYTDARSVGDFLRINNNGSYNQQIPYSIFQHSLSLNYNRGACYYLGENWEIDVGLGLGVRGNYRQYSTVPEDAIFDTNGGLFWRYDSTREPLHVTLSASILFALGYHF